MKKITLLYVFIFLSAFSSKAQDYILKKNGEEKYCWIKEISEKQIIYSDTIKSDTIKKFMVKSDVFMIRFRNGIKEVYGISEIAKKEDKVLPLKTKLNSSKILFIANNAYLIDNKKFGYRQVRSILADLDDAEINALLKEARAHGTKANIAGFGSIPFGIASLVCYSSYSDVNYKYSGYYKSYNENWLIGAGICASVSIGANIYNVVHKVKRAQCMKKAVKLYNEKIKVVE